MNLPERPTGRQGLAGVRLPGRLRRAGSRSRGQAMVEFVAVLLPLLLLVVGIVQFGLLFAANVTLTNAAREGARAGTIYLYDHSITSNGKYRNDAARCGDVVDAATQAFGLLSTSSPNFSAPLTSGACPLPSSDSLTDGDVTISYCDHVNSTDGPCPDPADPSTACVPDTRQGCLMQVTLTYRSDIIVPFLGDIIGHDSGGRFVQRVSAAMVVN